MEKQLTNYKSLNLCPECGQLEWKDKMYVCQMNGHIFFLCRECAMSAIIENPYIQMEEPGYLNFYKG